MNLKDMTVFVPTRGSAKRLLYIVNKFPDVKRIYLAVSQLDKLPELPDNCFVIRLDGLANKRHHFVKMAKSFGLQYCLQCDDDLGGNLQELGQGILEMHERNPYLGSVAGFNESWLRAGRTALPISHEFVLKGFPSAIFSMSVKAYLSTPGYTVQTMEDVEVGAYMNSLGFNCGGYTSEGFSHMRGRFNKPVSAGGQDEAYRNEVFPKVAEVIRQLPTVKRVNLTFSAKDQSYHSAVFWEWETLLKAFLKASGSSYYEDTTRKFPK